MLIISLLMCSLLEQVVARALGAIALVSLPIKVEETGASEFLAMWSHKVKGFAKQCFPRLIFGNQLELIGKVWYVIEYEHYN